MSIAEGAVTTTTPTPTPTPTPTTDQPADGPNGNAAQPPRARPYSTPAPTSQKLGEELPVFCERCGYQLFGLPPLRCDRCDILHFHCPECAHHQPINTLRPAAQRVIGRLRGVWLVGVVFVKLMFFWWSLFAFGAVAGEVSYGVDYDAYQVQQQNYNKRMQTYQAALAVYNAQVAAQGAAANAAQAVSPETPTQPIPPTPPVWINPQRVARGLKWDDRVALSIMGFVFGLFARMMLLRWRRAVAVGGVLAGLIATALVCGVAIRRATEREWLPWPWDQNFPELFVYTCGSALIGALVVWPLWVMLVRAFLPTRTGNALLEWQRSLSNKVSALARDPVTA